MNTLLKWNAEFAKNIWLELSVQRLVAMPAIIGMIVLLVGLNGGHAVNSVLHYIAVGGIVVLGMLWGVKTSADSILDEYNERTWDWQKMSVIGPWKLAWGKLFGSTIYNWYGAGICFLLYILTSFGQDNPVKEITTGFLLLVGMVTVQGLMILISLQMIRKSDGRTKIKSNRVFLPGLIVVGFFYNMFSARFLDSFHTSISWYGIVSGSAGLAMVSALFLCGWVVAGLYRSMRAELQFSDAPTWWLAFIISSLFMNYGYFVSISEIGFTGGLAGALLLSFLQFLFVLYVIVLSEPKDIVNFRLLETSWKSGDRRTFFQNLPLWMATLPVVFIFGFLGVLFLNLALKGSMIEDLAREFNIQTSGKSFLFILALLGFVLRDFGILLLLNFSDRRKRADSAWIIYLVLLYAILPALTYGVGIGGAFYPDFTANPFVMILFPLAEAGIVIFLLYRRWNEIRVAA
jgi:hypothetical protein